MGSMDVIKNFGIALEIQGDPVTSLTKFIGKEELKEAENHSKNSRHNIILHSIFEKTNRITVTDNFSFLERIGFEYDFSTIPEVIMNSLIIELEYTRYFQIKIIALQVDPENFQNDLKEIVEKDKEQKRAMKEWIPGYELLLTFSPEKLEKLILRELSVLSREIRKKINEKENWKTSFFFSQISKEMEPFLMKEYRQENSFTNKMRTFLKPGIKT